MFGDIKVDEITDVDVFKATYFAEGFDAQNAGYTVSSKLFRTFDPNVGKSSSLLINPLQ